VCECWTCKGGCEKTFSSPRARHTCGVCRRCCECRGCPRYASDRQLGVVEFLGRGGRSLLTRLPRTVGVELELGKWGTLPQRDGGKIPGIRYTSSHDWSVKPSEQELVTAPLRGDALVRGMLELSRATTLAGVEVNESCAFHVHVGGKDLSYWEIRRLLEVYHRVEGEVYSHLAAPHRLRHPSIHYCQMMTVPHTSKGCERCGRYDLQYPHQRHTPEGVESVLARMWQARTTEDLKVCMLRMLYGLENPSNFPDTVASRKGGHYEFARYFGLNLHSWMHRMTVEWRMKEATTDPWELVFWPLWCGWFVHAITRMSDVDAQGVKGVRHLTEVWMPGYFGEWLERHGV
jgi:hypothetical protein